MRIAFTSKEDHLFSKIDPVLESANFFLILDPENLNEYECVLNPYVGKGKAAEINCARFLVQQKIDTLVTGRCGKIAYQYLKSADIKIMDGVSGNVLTSLQSINFTNHLKSFGIRIQL
jgi:predicted Fe-Mo cluster-binding NifX family protein